MSRKQLTEEEVNLLDSMIKKIVSKQINLGKIKCSFEDVVSELWINALQIIEKTQKLDYNYIAKASFYHMVDITRKSVRNECTSYENSFFNQLVSIDESSKKSGSKDSYSGEERHTYSYFSSSSPESIEDRIVKDEILGLFEEGSKEYNYVKAWMRILGIVDEGNYDELPTKAFDGYIAVDVLGYAASKSNGYARLRDKVRQILIDNGYCK